MTKKDKRGAKSSMLSPALIPVRRYSQPSARGIKNATSILDYIFRELAVSYLDRTDLAHVKPAGASFDDLHKGDEGANVTDISEDSATKSLEMLKSISSTGYLRKRLPQELMSLKPSADTAPMALDVTTNADAVATAAVSAPVTTLDERTKAKMQGYFRCFFHS